MTKSVLTVLPMASMRGSLNLMLEDEIGAVVIVDKAQPLGILTERNLIRLVAGDTYRHDQPVAEVMSEPLETVEAKTPEIRALEIMSTRRNCRLPVLSDEEFTGVITAKDLIQWVLSASNQFRIEELQSLMEWQGVGEDC